MFPWLAGEFCLRSLVDVRLRARTPAVIGTKKMKTRQDGYHYIIFWSAGRVCLTGVTARPMLSGLNAATGFTPEGAV